MMNKMPWMVARNLRKRIKGLKREHSLLADVMLITESEQMKGLYVARRTDIANTVRKLQKEYDAIVS